MRALLVVMMAVLALSGCANHLFYFPDRVDYEPRLAMPIPHEDVWIDSSDDVRLHGWFLKAKGEAKATVVYLHGNAQNLTAHASYIDWLPAAGYNVLITDYRGYGLSAGEPSREGVLADARASWFYARSRADVNPQEMILMGQSLGGATALALAGRERLPGLKAVIADSAFSSYSRIGREKILQIPVLGYLLWPFSPLIVSAGFSPEPLIKNIAPVPLLLIHGDQDAVIPASHSDRLFERAGTPSWLWTLQGGGHTEAFARFRETLVPRVLKFMDYAVSGDASRLDRADQGELTVKAN